MNTDKPRAARFRAFTLIELLIVVAIIAILAAIAVPNFLEAQVRAKVSRAKADMRTIATGLESYVVDNNHYPPAYGDTTPTPPEVLESNLDPILMTRNPRIRRVAHLTTPVSYLTSVPSDPFSREVSTLYPISDVRVFLYADKETYEKFVPQALDPGANRTDEANIYRILWGRQVTSSPWLLRSTGPQGGEDTGLGTSVDKRDVYDPTNGTVSVGNVFYLGGVGVLEGQGAP